MPRAFLATLLMALVAMPAVAQSSAPSAPVAAIPRAGGMDKTGVFVDSLALLGIGLKS